MTPNRKRGLLLVLAAIAAGAGCSSVIKGQSATLDRGREDDDAKPFVDISRYVKNDDLTPPAGVPATLLAEDPDAPGRKKWQSFKHWPRNYKFAIAVAPLREEFRRAPPEGTDELGEPRANFSTRAPEAPLDDDGKGPDKQPRRRAEVPPTDALFGFQVKTIADARPADVTTGSTSQAPPAETPAAPSTEKPVSAPVEPVKAPEKEPVKEPAQPVEEELPRPKRIGMKDAPGTATRHYAGGGASDPSTPTGSSAAAAIDKPRDTAVEQRRREIKDISDKEGMNFSIDSDEFQKRMTGLLEEFRVFENVDPIKYGDDQKSLEGLFRQADARKDDFLLVCSLRRNKVSYRGVDLGPAALDNLIEFLILYPEFANGIHREQYECDVELYVRLYDVRSRHAILDRTFEGRDTLMLSTWQRGWHPLRNWTSWSGTLYSSERLFYNVGEYVRPGAWLDMEVKLLNNLQNAVKTTIDDQSFDTETNRFHDLTTRDVKTLDVRQFGLVVGITEYGPAAQAKLAEWAAGGKPLDQAQKDMVALYDGQPVKLGTRPYAESDAAKVAKELLAKPGALESGGLSDSSVVSNLATLLGKAATAKELRGAFRQVARARAEDRVFIYLNGETLVMDDPVSADAPPVHYFLPYDVDLGEVERLWKQDHRQAKAYLDEHALSFEWIEACFYRDSAQDHIFLQSKHSMFIVDCSFPGQYTRDRFCPTRAEQIKRGMTIPGGLVEPIGPRVEPPKDQEKEKPPEKSQPEKPPEKQPEPADEEPARPKRVGFVNPSRFEPTMVYAQTAAPVGSNGVAAATSEGKVQFSVTTGFLERIAAGGKGRFVVLTTGPNERSLDVPSVKQGGFVYYFTQFLDPSRKERFGRLKEKNGDFLAKAIVDYATDRLESESRQEGSPQHVLSFGDLDKPLVLMSAQK